MDQQIEHLGLKRNPLTAAEQFPPACIKSMIGKEKFHVVALLSAYGGGLKE
jgi:hypothetical protein